MWVGLFKESKTLLLWLNGVFYDLLIHVSCSSSSKLSVTENCKMCYWRAALKGWPAFPEQTKQDLGLSVLALLLSPLAVMFMLPYTASLQGRRSGLWALGFTALSSRGEDPWCPEMPLLEAAWTSSGFGPGPSCGAAPALWFRYDLGNIVQVIPFVSISPSPPFSSSHPQIWDCVTVIPCCKAFRPLMWHTRGDCSLLCIPYH